jgi:DNA-binding MarR family transcriptional regulator
MTSLPYAGTSGWSGSDTSRDRALSDDASGRTKIRQAEVLTHLNMRMSYGATWKELGEEFGWHHGIVSGALSVLHKDGRIARLKDERRNKCSVYVALEWVQGREVVEQGNQKSSDQKMRELIASNILQWLNGEEKSLEQSAFLPAFFTAGQVAELAEGVRRGHFG